MNKKQIVSFMNRGPLQMAFVAQAMKNYAELTLRNREAVMKEMGPGSFIDGKYWLAIAKEVKINSK